MKRFGLFFVALVISCNSGTDGDTDSGNNSGSGGSSTSAETDPSMSATESESETANTATASGSTTGSGSTTMDGSGTSDRDTSGESSSGSETGSSSSTGTASPQELCEDTDGTWDESACEHYVCGVPNDCEAIIPGCDCGPDANFVEGQGCVIDEACNTFACGDDVECIVGLEYCQTSFPGQKGAPIVYECFDMPKACADMVDCDCLAAELELPPPGACAEPTEDGLIVQVFLP